MAGTTLTWAPALPSSILNGESVKGCIGYRPTTDLAASLAFFHVLTNFRRLVLGGVVDRFGMKFGHNVEPMFSASGPAARQLTTGLPSTPAAFTTVGGNPPSGLIGELLIGATPYLLAAKFLEADIMRALAAGGADTQLPMKDGATPLMAAAGMGIVAPAQDEKRGTDRRGLAILDGGKAEPDSQVLDAVSAALTLGSNVNAVNPAGETALHIASAQGYVDVVKLLAANGADVNVRNARGLTPLAVLMGRPGAKRQGMIDLLRSLGATE